MHDRNSDLKIVSLIPSATEIVAALGLARSLVGRSHECDYPPEIDSLPICTQPKFNPEGSSLEIHNRVTDLLQSALSVYQIETDTLKQLQPTHILTQDQCEVCACSLPEVETAVRQLLDSQPQIISLQPKTLAGVWDDIQRVADALGTPAESVLTALQQRTRTITEKAHQLTQPFPTVACIEWTEPLMAAGNWIPELVELAGGQPVLGIAGQHSPWTNWQALLEAEPNFLIFMPCGFGLERTRKAVQQLASHPQWSQLQAVSRGKVYITDGNAYFNRPGPRLVESLEILAEILHPDLFSFGHRGQGWEALPMG